MKLYSCRIREDDSVQPPDDGRVVEKRFLPSADADEDQAERVVRVLEVGLEVLADHAFAVRDGFEALLQVGGVPSVSGFVPSATEFGAVWALRTVKEALIVSRNEGEEPDSGAPPHPPRTP